MSALRFAEGYIKPRQSRQFASSAKKRASIRALGSITYLQRYYASGGAVGEGFSEEQFELARANSYLQLLTPRSGLKSPSPETLLRQCHADIQRLLEVWGIISYPHGDDGQDQPPDSPLSLDDDQSRQLGHGKDGSNMSINSQQQHRYDSVSIDLLALLESSTRAISSIRKYSMHAPVLTSTALTVHRQAALSVIEMLSILEQENRIHDGDENQPEGYCYARVQFGDLEDERIEMKNYLSVVQEHLFRPQAERIETQLEQLLVKDPAGQSLQGVSATPKWIHDSAWPAPTEGNAISLACKFRLEFKIPEGSFKPVEIVKKTDLGREQLQNWVQLIVQRGIQEAKLTLETKDKTVSVATLGFSLDF
ncbi:hypothetical protein BGZ83_005034 [Gryganskiella cystojenkinii]|nr:hypothetical protein BGZ83_005034 [Gryganskiella cystojenkinii]